MPSVGESRQIIHPLARVRVGVRVRHRRPAFVCRSREAPALPRHAFTLFPPLYCHSWEAAVDPSQPLWRAPRRLLPPFLLWQLRGGDKTFTAQVATHSPPFPPLSLPLLLQVGGSSRPFPAPDLENNRRRPADCRQRLPQGRPTLHRLRGGRVALLLGDALHVRLRSGRGHDRVALGGRAAALLPGCGRGGSVEAAEAGAAHRAWGVGECVSRVQREKGGKWVGGQEEVVGSGGKGGMGREMSRVRGVGECVSREHGKEGGEGRREGRGGRGEGVSRAQNVGKGGKGRAIHEGRSE